MYTQKVHTVIITTAVSLLYIKQVLCLVLNFFYPQPLTFPLSLKLWRRIKKKNSILLSDVLVFPFGAEIPPGLQGYQFIQQRDRAFPESCCYVTLESCP